MEHGECTAAVQTAGDAEPASVSADKQAAVCYQSGHHSELVGQRNQDLSAVGALVAETGIAVVVVAVHVVLEHAHHSVD